VHSDVDLSGAEYEALRRDASAAFADALRQHQQLPRRAFKTFASILANCIMNYCVVCPYDHRIK
jgi:hypothetical protein